MGRRRGVFERLRPARGEAGFSLIEVLVALTVFTIMTLGLVPLLAASVRGTASSRGFTVAKNLVTEAMEKARGLPYYVSYSAQPTRVDLLDFYFPAYKNPSNRYTITCTSTSTDPACPNAIPSGYTIDFGAQFVAGDGTTPEQFNNRTTVPTTYTWNSATADTPPSQMLKLDVTATWTQPGGPGGGTHTYDLTSLFSARSFDVTQPAAAGNTPLTTANLKLRALGRVRYVVQAETGFSYSAGASEMTITAASAFSRMEQGNSILAEGSARSFDAKVIRPASGTTTSGTDLASLTGANAYSTAPPDFAGSGDVNDDDLTHPNTSGGSSLRVAGHGDTEAFTWTALTYFGLNYSWDSYYNVYGYTYNDNNANKLLEAYGKNQMSSSAPLRMVTSRNSWQVNQQSNNAENQGSGEDTYGFMFAFPLADSNNASTNKSTRGYVLAKAWDIFMLPVSFISNTTTLQSLLYVNDFRMTLNCVSTGNPSTASVTASWSATLKYWADSTNDNVLNGSYQTVSLAGNLGTDPLQAIKTSNPLVYDGNPAANDVYLFDDPANNNEGYLTDWKSIATIPTSEDAAGQVTTAQLSDAIRIQTVPLTPSIADSDWSIGIGNSECVAEEYR